MNDKQCTVRHLIEYPDVFADIVNAFLFDGKQEVVVEELTATELHNRQYRMPQDADSVIAEGDDQAAGNCFPIRQALRAA